MRQRPANVSDPAVLAAVRDHWRADVDAVEHLPVGFGAHHWRASREGRPMLFVTLDALGDRHDLAQLTAAYAGAAELARAGLEFVHAGLPPYAVPFGPGALSVTPWLDGTSPDEVDPVTTREMLTRLHQAPPPAIPRWQPLVPPTFSDDLGVRVCTSWTLGPYGERARRAVVAKLPEVHAWVARYHRRAAEAAERTWVATHGEPHRANQLVTDHGTVLVDWESLKLAPGERDLTGLGGGDPACGRCSTWNGGWTRSTSTRPGSRLRTPAATMTPLRARDWWKSSTDRTGSRRGSGVARSPHLRHDRVESGLRSAPGLAVSTGCPIGGVRPCRSVGTPRAAPDGRELDGRGVRGRSS